MEFLQTIWTYVLNSWQILKAWVVDPVNQPTIIIIGLIAALIAIGDFIAKRLKSKPTPEEENKQNSLSSSAEDFAKAIIAANEQGKQTAEADLQSRDQQIAALAKAVEAMQTERQEAETEAEQTTIDTALAHLKEGNPSEAEAIFEEILEEQSKRGQQANKQAAAAARHIGALAFLHDTDKAHKAYKRATELDPDNADGWNELGQLQDRLGQLDNAIKSYETVLRLGNSSADQSLIAAALGNLGLIYETQGDLEKAEDAQLKSLKIEEQLGNKQGIATSLGNLGLIYLTQGDLEKAEDAQLKSLKIDEQLGNKQGMAASYGNLGTIYYTQGDLEKAEDAQLKALKINEQLANKKDMASIYGNLGLIYQTQSDLEKAEDAQLKALKINEQLGNKQGIATSYGNLGNIYYTQGDLEKAEDAQLKSLKIKEQLGNKQGMAASYGNLGAISELKGNMSEACAHWQKALALFTEVGAKREMEQASNLLKAANYPDIKKSASD